jgi:hypothetical protein
MRRMLIKSILMLIVAYIGSSISQYYALHPAAPLETNITIWTMILIIPGLICGAILGYDAIFAYVKNNARKPDLRYFALFIVLILIVLAPYLAFVFHISMDRTTVRIFSTIQTSAFTPFVSLLAGYTFTQVFVSKK